MTTKNPLYGWVKNLVIATHHYLTEDDFYELPNYPSAMLSGIYKMGSELSDEYPVDEWLEKYDEYIDEAYSDYLDLGNDELDKEYNKEKFQLEIVMMIADEFPISIVNEPLLRSELIKESPQSRKMAIGVGMSFTVVPSNYVTHIDLENTNSKVILDGIEYDLHKSITFDGSRSVDRLLDHFEEYNISEHAVRNTLESEEHSIKL